MVTGRGISGMSWTKKNGSWLPNANTRAGRKQALGGQWQGSCWLVVSKSDYSWGRGPIKAVLACFIAVSFGCDWMNTHSKMKQLKRDRVVGILRKSHMSSMPSWHVRLAWNSLCSSNWSWTHGSPPTSVSGVLKLQALATTIRWVLFCFWRSVWFRASSQQARIKDPDFPSSTHS